MKKFFFAVFVVLFAVLLIVPLAGAAPFLTCDPYPPPAEGQPDSFEITVSPLAPYIVPATAKPDGTVYLMHDLAAIAAMGAGAHTATAIAIKDGWRSGSSNQAPFTKPGLVSPNISIVSKPPGN